MKVDNVLAPHDVVVEPLHVAVGLVGGKEVLGKYITQLFVSVCRTCDLYFNLTPESPHHYRKQHIRFSCYSYLSEF